MSFDSALSHRDDRATSGANAATASGGADSFKPMAKKTKPTSTETPATTATNTPQTPLAVLQSAVRKAERAFLTAVEAGSDGATQRDELKSAKVALAAFMSNRLPLAVEAAHAVFSANADLTTPEAIAAITELRSALSGIARPAPVVVTAAPTE